MESAKIDRKTLNAEIKKILLNDNTLIREVIKEILIKDKTIIKDVVKDAVKEIMVEKPKETDEEWLKKFDKIIDETFEEYDEVFKALA